VNGTASALEHDLKEVDAGSLEKIMLKPTTQSEMMIRGEIISL
jgi:hypothetical protein